MAKLVNILVCTSLLALVVYNQIIELQAHKPVFHKGEDLHDIAKAIRRQPLKKDENYKILNAYLTLHLKNNDDVRANLDAAIYWLDLKEPLGDSLTESLKKFTELSELDIDERCTERGHSILLANDLATGGEAHKLTLAATTSDDDEFDRINKILHKIFKKHAKDCFFNLDDFGYIRKFEKKYNELRGNHQQLELVEALMFNLLDRPKVTSSIESNGPLAIIRNLANGMESIKGKESARFAYDAILIIAKNDPKKADTLITVDENETKLAVSIDSIQESLEKYILEPCRYFVHHLGPDIFGPADFDAEMIDKVRGKDLEKIRYEKNVEFYTAWLHYRRCNNLLNLDQLTLLADLTGIAYEEYTN